MHLHTSRSTKDASKGVSGRAEGGRMTGLQVGKKKWKKSKISIFRFFQDFFEIFRPAGVLAWLTMILAVSHL